MSSLIRLMVLAILGLSLSLTVVGCDRNGAEKTEDAIEDAGDSIEDAGDEAKDAVD